MRGGPSPWTRERNRSSGYCQNIPSSPLLGRLTAESPHCTPPPVLSLTPTLQASVNWHTSTQSSLADCTRPSVHPSDGHSSMMSDAPGAREHSSESDDSVFLPINVETPQRRRDNETYPVCKETGGSGSSQIRSAVMGSEAEQMAQQENTPSLFSDDYLLQNSYVARNLRSLRDGSYSESVDVSSCGAKSLSFDTSHDSLQIKKKSSIVSSGSSAKMSEHPSDGHSSMMSDASGAREHSSESDNSIFLPINVETPQRRGDTETYPMCKETGGSGRSSTSQIRSTGSEAEQENTPSLFLDDYLLQNSYAARNLRSLRDGSYSESVDVSSCGAKSLSFDTSHGSLQIKKKSSVLSSGSSAKTSEHGNNNCRSDVSAISMKNAWEAETSILCESKELQRCEITDTSIGRGVILRRSMLDFYDQSNPSFFSSASSGGQKRLFDSVDNSGSHIIDCSQAGGATGLTREIQFVTIGDEHRLKRGHFVSEDLHGSGCCKGAELKTFGKTDSDSGRKDVKIHDSGEISMPLVDYEMEPLHTKTTSSYQSDRQSIETTPKHCVHPNFKPLFTSSCGSPTEVVTTPMKLASSGDMKRDMAETDSSLSEDIVCICSDVTEMLQPAIERPTTNTPSHEVDGVAVGETCSHGKDHDPTRADGNLEYVSGTNIDWLRQRQRVPFADVCVESLAHFSTRLADRTSDAMSPRRLGTNVTAASLSMETDSDGQQGSSEMQSNCGNISLHEDRSGHFIEDNVGTQTASVDGSDKQSGYTADESSEASASMQTPATEPAQDIGISKYMAWEKRLPQANQQSQKDTPKEKERKKKVTCFMSLPSSHSSDHGQSDYFTPTLSRKLKCRAFMVSS